MNISPAEYPEAEGSDVPEVMPRFERAPDFVAAPVPPCATLTVNLEVRIRYVELLVLSDVTLGNSNSSKYDNKVWSEEERLYSLKPKLAVAELDGIE